MFCINTVIIIALFGLHVQYYIWSQVFFVLKYRCTNYIFALDTTSINAINQYAWAQGNAI